MRILTMSPSSMIQISAGMLSSRRQTTGVSMTGLGLVFFAAIAPPLTLNAQSARSVVIVGGIGVQVFRASHPEGGTSGLIALIGARRVVSDQVSATVIATAAQNFFSGDDISICHGNPEVGCLPDPVYPTRFYTLELQGAFAPVPEWPVRIVGGGGVSHAAKAREAERHPPEPDLGSKTQAMWRAGLDVSLGSSLRAPRLQVTRAGFWSAPFSTSFVDGLTISFPL